MECLSSVQQYILRLIRVREREVERWLNATKNLEEDLPVTAYLEYASITSQLNTVELKNAYLNALNVVGHLINDLAGDFDFDIDIAFMMKLRSLVKNSF